MPFNGSGTFIPIAAPNYPAVAGQPVYASQFNANMTDLFSGFDNCITRDGQSPATANIPMGGNKLTGLGTPSTAADALVWGQNASVLNLIATNGIAPPSVVSPQGIYSRYASTWVDSTRPVDGRITEFVWDSGVLTGRFLDDAYSVASSWLSVTGTSLGASAISLAGTGINLNGSVVATTSGSTGGVAVTDTGASGANIRLTGNGGVTPKKTLRSFNGSFEVVNDGYSAVILGLTDAGALSVASASITGAMASATIATTGDNTGIGLTRSRTKTATTSRNTTTVAADDPHLIMPLSVGTWAFELLISCWGPVAGTGGIKANMAFSGTRTAAQVAAGYSVLNSIIASAGPSTDFGTTTIATNPIRTGGSASVADYIRLSGNIVVTVAGNISFQWAQNSSNANDISVGIGSYLNCTRTA